MNTLDRFTEVAALKSERFEAMPGLVVEVRELTLAQRLDYSATVQENMQAGVAYLVRATVRDPDNGEILFPDYYDFNAISPPVYEALARKCLEVAGLVTVGKD